MNRKTPDFQDVIDNVTTRSPGYIQAYKILNEKRRGNTMVVELRTKVYESKIQAQFPATPKNP